tara:strand:- start:328 stop:2652 length:2325 start_codon:yes stop_codon:yes gene_type:complete
MTYLILDLETQIHVSHSRKANPFDDRNWLVYRGWKRTGDKQCNYVRFSSKEAVRPLGALLDGVDVIVAHNAKFELLYETMVPEGREQLIAYFARGGRIWCTQLAEYLLNAQERKYHMNSLDSIVETYGGRKKIDGMKELWNAGVQTSDIDPDLVIDYLIGTEEEGRNSGDIGNTERVYLGQLELAKSLEMEAAIRVRMDSLCATSEMEYNGIKVNVEVAKADLQRLNADLATATTELDKYINDIPSEVGFSWTSPVCKSAILFGGTIRYQVQTTYLDEATGELARKKAVERWPLFDKEPVDPATLGNVQSDGLYYRGNPAGEHWAQDTFLGGKKKGEPKFKNVDVPGELKVKYQDFFWELPGYVDAKELEIKTTKTTDGRGVKLYTTDSDTIDLLGNLDIPFLKAMSRKSALDKEIGTYYVKRDNKGDLKGMLTCVDPVDHIVHHGLNHTSTVTGRLSSSNPNCQNIPRGDKSRVKAMFESRFGADGVCGEIDYSQLEVVVTGLLTGDKKLVQDLNNKVDFHCMRVAARENITYEEALEWCKNEEHIKHAVWSVFRTECKIFSFQRAYGAGASTIAITANMSVDAVKDMIIAEDKLYPDVVKFHEGVTDSVEGTAEPFRDPERGYKTYRRGTWQSPTGTMYTWCSWDAPKFLRERYQMDSFSPPEIKNYPTQGTGGEIVQMILGQLFRWFMKTNNFGGKAFLTNTVHDCVWFDMHKDVVDEVMAGSKKIMEAVPMFLKHFFGIECPVPFPVDVEVGPNMLELSHWHPKQERELT